jgi:hypothetical protein
MHFYLERLARPDLDRVLASVAAGFFALLVLVFLPAQIAAANHNELHGGFLLAAALSLIAAGGIGGFVYLLVSALPQSVVRYAAAALSGLAVSALILGSFITPLTVDVGLIDGGDAEVTISPLLAILDMAALVALVVGLVVFYSHVRDFLVNAFAMLGVMMAGLSGFLVVSGEITRQQVQAVASEINDTDSFYRLSTEENLLVILLDNFDAEFFHVLLEENPFLYETFDGFTFFRDASGISSFTVLALPTIHSGETLDLDRTMPETYQQHVRENSFLSQAAEAGAGSELVGPVRNTCPAGTICRNRDFLRHSGSTGVSDEWGVLVAISLFRAAPHALKPWLFDGPSLYFESQGADDENLVLHEFANRLRSDAVSPQVRFVHLRSTHAPFNRSANCRIIDPDNASMTMMFNNMRCAVDGVSDLLQALRDADIYDATTIVILADHGISAVTGAEIARDGREALRLGESSAIRYDGVAAVFQVPEADLVGQREVIDSRLLGSNPLFVVKPPDSRGRLRIDELRAVSLIDVRATLCSYTELCDSMNGYNAYDAPAPHERQRPFNEYTIDGRRAVADSLALSEMVTPHIINESLILPAIDIFQANPVATESIPIFPFSRPGYFRGFGLHERWGRWSNSLEASVILCVAQRPQQQTTAVLEGRVYLTQPGQRQRVTISINGQRVFRQVYRYGSERDLDSQQWRLGISPSDFDENGCIDLEFDLPDAVPPPPAWRDADSGLLAIGLHSLRIEN